jgi:hypothetical protein
MVRLNNLTYKKGNFKMNKYLSYKIAALVLFSTISTYVNASREVFDPSRYRARVCVIMRHKELKTSGDALFSAAYRGMVAFKNLGLSFGE